MLTIKTNTYLTVSLTALLTLSPLSFADNHAGEATTDGAFTTLMVAAPDTGKYIASLKNNSGAFKAVGASAAGVCVTQSGHEYPGQMMIWSGYPSIQAALIGSSKYDPAKAPQQVARLREVKYGVTWKSLKPFKLNPGYERVQRIQVANEKVPAFVAAMSELEAAIQNNGHADFGNGIFVSIGGGSHEVQTLMVRSVSRDAAAAGALFDEYFSGTAAWAGAFQAVSPHIDAVISDNFESCEQIYAAE
jgi:hypothetical protein